MLTPFWTSLWRFQSRAFPNFQAFPSNKMWQDQAGRNEEYGLCQVLFPVILRILLLQWNTIRYECIAFLSCPFRCSQNQPRHMRQLEGTEMDVQRVGMFLPTIVILKTRNPDDLLSQKTPQSWTIKIIPCVQAPRDHHSLWNCSYNAPLRGDTKQITALAIRLGRVPRQDSLSREP